MTNDQFIGYDYVMTYASISELKTNPASIISESLDYPVAIQKRNKTQAYLVGKKLFDQMVTQLEDAIDKQAVEDTDFSKGKDFEELAKELGL